MRPVVVRFAPTVHGAGDHGFVATLVAIARGPRCVRLRRRRRQPLAGRAPARRGALVRLAVDDAPAGAVLHATAEEGVPARTIAEAIGRGLGLPVESVPAERAVEHFGWIGTVLRRRRARRRAR